MCSYTFTVSTSAPTCALQQLWTGHTSLWQTYSQGRPLFWTGPTPVSRKWYLTIWYHSTSPDMSTLQDGSSNVMLQSSLGGRKKWHLTSFVCEKKLASFISWGTCSCPVDVIEKYNGEISNAASVSSDIYLLWWIVELGSEFVTCVAYTFHALFSPTLAKWDTVSQAVKAWNTGSVKDFCGPSDAQISWAGI